MQDLRGALKDLDDYQMNMPFKPDIRSKSLPRPSKPKPDFGPRRDFDDQRHYDIEDGKEEFEMHDLQDIDFENYRERRAQEDKDWRRGAREDLGYRDRDRGYDPEDEDFEFDIPRSRKAAYERRYIL